jgi:outer membrane lipoprotein carrier protein
VKKTILFSLIFLAGFTAYSQNAKDAEKLLDRISQRYKKFKTIKADFLYSIESKVEKINEKQRGTIVVKGNKFRLDVANQVIICDNKTIWTYSKEVNEVQINHYSPKEGAIRLDDIFTMYNKGFLFKIAETRKEGKNDIAIFELTPKDKKKSFYKIKLTVDKTNQSISKSEVFDKNGSVHTYTISNQVPNIKYEDNQFSFNVKKYPGVEVVDLR